MMHPVTGEPVPDETARVPAWRYINPRPAAWPEADFIVGNPPFIGTARMREALGDGYVEAIRRVYPNVPDSADYVMFWWDKAAELVRGRPGAALRLDHHQQPAPDLQPPRARTPAGRGTPRGRPRASAQAGQVQACPYTSRSPSPTTRGWTAPRARRCASR